MRNMPPRVGILLLALMLAVMPACKQPPPKVLCVMRNPQTGLTVTMYKEVPFKVPTNYDEKKHIAQWKQEQILQGFTDEVSPAP